MTEFSFRFEESACEGSSKWAEEYESKRKDLVTHQRRTCVFLFIFPSAMGYQAVDQKRPKR